MKAAKTLVLLLLLLTTIASARRRDPLTEAEADQIRQAALEPYKRLQLYIKFTGARLDAIDQLRADPRQADGRGRKIHDLLEDFTALMDEINENLDQYQGRPLSKDDRKDFRRGLKEMITACDAWDGKLKALKSAMDTDPQTQKEAKDFNFVFQDAEEALKSSADMAREYAETTPLDEKPGKKK
jgi:soluble cytochrome b562